MTRKSSTTSTTPKYGIFRGETYAVPQYDDNGNFARYDTLNAAQAALPALQDQEARFARRWGYTAPTFVIQGC